MVENNKTEKIRWRKEKREGRDANAGVGRFRFSIRCFCRFF